MNDDKIIILNLADISLLKEALRNYYETNKLKTENFQNQTYSTLRKLYSIQVSLNKSPNKELYVQNL